MFPGRVGRSSVGHNPVAGVVPGALGVYDLLDLARAIAPRRLTVRDPVDPIGRPQ
jgi:hypothetical protein